MLLRTEYRKILTNCNNYSIIADEVMDRFGEEERLSSVPEYNERSFVHRRVTYKGRLRVEFSGRNIMEMPETEDMDTKNFCGQT